MDKDKKQNQEEEFDPINLIKRYTIRLDGGNLDQLPEVFDKEKIKEQRATGPSISSVRVTDYSDMVDYYRQKYLKRKAERERLKKEQEEAAAKSAAASHTEKVESRSRSSSSERGK